MACKDGQSPKKKNNILSGKEELVHNINIGNMILDAFKSKPDFIGQIDPVTKEQTTFRQMHENSVKCALWLQKLYYKSIVISICTCNQMLAYIPYLASLYIGAIINPWDERYFEDNIRIMYFLVEYEPEIIFIDSKNYRHLVRAIKLLNENEEVITVPKIITFDRIEDVDSLEVILNGDFDEAEIDHFSCEEMNPMDIVAVMFSSNATSYPGKAHIRYFALTYPSNQEVPAISPNDIGLWYGSLTWTYNLILTVRSIVSYVTVIKPWKFTDEDMYDVIEEYKVTWVFLESSMCNQLFQTDIRMYNVSSLKQLVFGDSIVHCDVYEKLAKYFTNASIVQVYCISEACIVATYQSNNPISSSGYLAKNIQLMILNITMKDDVGPNVLGEIWYRFMCKWCNPKTCKSPYCCNYQAKKNNIKTNTFVAITSMWHCTGDYGYYEENGNLFVIDKINHLIKYKTFHISPLRIENVLKRHPVVSEVIVRSVPNHSDGQHPKAYVKKNDEAEVTEEELKEFVAINLPNIYQLRGGVCFTTDMPYLPNGQIDRILVQRW